MKKNFTKHILMGIVLLLTAIVANAQDIWRGNSTWENKSPYFPIVEENFQDWNYKDDLGYGLQDSSKDACATNARAFKDNYTTFNVQRPVDARQNKPNGKVTFFLDFCLITPLCDTQSGTLYKWYPNGTGNDYKGPSWTNVSTGCINVYDNYQTVRPVTMGVGGDGSGSITTSLIPLLERVQWSASSYGLKRGFNMEIGYLLEDKTIYWDTLMYFAGSSVFARPQVYADMFATVAPNTYFSETHRGTVYETTFGSGVENVYLRFRPTNPIHNRQIVRLHDFKLYGIAPETADATNPNGTGVKNVKFDNDLQIFGRDGIYHLNKYATVVVYNLSGNIVKQFNNVNNVNIQDFANGVYMIQANSTEGMAVKKVIR